MILGHILCYRFWFTKIVCVQEASLNNLIAEGKRTFILEFPNFSCQVSSCKFEIAKVSINTIKILSIKLTHATSKWFPRVISTFHLHVQCSFVELSKHFKCSLHHFPFSLLNLYLHMQSDFRCNLYEWEPWILIGHGIKSIRYCPKRFER